MQTGLEGATVLVTGASGGLGTAVAEDLAAHGARLVLHTHRRPEVARELAERLATASIVVQADLTDEASVDRMWEQAAHAFPQIDGLVVNAGVWPAESRPLQDLDLARWRETLDVDLTGAFLSCRGFFRHLAENPRDAASLVLVGSTAGLFGEAGHADYAAAKAGLMHGLLPSLKNEIVRLAPRGRANAVAPGWILTPMAESALGDADAIARQTQTVAMQKVARPEEVASVISFLLSPVRAGHVSGAVLPVHGGMEGRVLHPR
ncbi:MAG: SDR family NAD(P)-dependent oxidoreductase [Planctomycetota bacterium]